MNNLLKDLTNSNTACGVYTNWEDKDKFSVGYIIGYDEEFFVMEKIDPYGRQDGISCKLIKDVFKVETDSVYCKNIEKLFYLHNRYRYISTTFTENVALNVLKYAKEAHKICGIEIGESGAFDVIGFIADICNDKVTIDTVSTSGLPDGTSYIDLNDISEISCDSLDERKIEELYNMR